MYMQSTQRGGALSLENFVGRVTDVNPGIKQCTFLCWTLLLCRSTTAQPTIFESTKDQSEIKLEKQA